MKLEQVLKDLDYNHILENNNTLVINYPITTKIEDGIFHINHLNVNDFIIQLKTLLETSFNISFHKRNINLESSLITHCKRLVDIKSNYQYLDRGKNPFLFSSPSLNYDNSNFNAENAKSVFYVKYYEKYEDYFVDEGNNIRFDFINKDIKNTKNFIEKELKESYIEYTFPVPGLNFHPMDNNIVLQQTINKGVNTLTIMEELYGLNSVATHSYSLQFRINIEETKKIAQHKITSILQTHNTILKILKSGEISV